MNALTTYDKNDQTQGRVCPGCGVEFTPTPPSRVYCRPTCGARHQRSGQVELPLLDEPVTELPTRGG